MSVPKRRRRREMVNSSAPSTSSVTPLSDGCSTIRSSPSEPAAGAPVRGEETTALAARGDWPTGVQTPPLSSSWLVLKLFQLGQRFALGCLRAVQQAAVVPASAIRERSCDAGPTLARPSAAQLHAIRQL